MTFNGFSKELPLYIKNVHENNSKQWYEAHKKEYALLVKEPFYAFTELFAEQMKRIDKNLITDPRCCLSRMNRDSRYIRDGYLYKDSVWITFKRPSENWLEDPAFYFEISSEKCSYGMGYYIAKAAVMADYRAFIADNPRAFKAAVKPIDEDELLHPIGQKYKKPQVGCPKGLEEWYHFKNFYVSADMPLSVVEKKDIFDIVSQRFEKIKELYWILANDIPEIRKEKGLQTNLL